MTVRSTAQSSGLRVQHVAPIGFGQDTEPGVLNPEPRTLNPAGVLVAGLLAALLGLGLTGCGSDVPYELVPVSGKVTYDDGSLIPAARMEIILQPQNPPADPNVPPRAARGEVNPAEGTFSTVSTYQYGDGAIVGQHKVQLVSYDQSDAITDAVPEVYRNVDTTPLTVAVTPGKNELELKVDKP